jgi:hypothetical protein
MAFQENAMSVIKSFAHHAHQTLVPLAPNKFKRSHVYELMAAGLGFNSWAALHQSQVLVDADEASRPPDFDRNVVGRALQLGFLQSEAQGLAEHFQTLHTQQPFGCIPLSELDKDLFGSESDTDADTESEDEDFEDDEDWPVEDEDEPVRQILKTSKLLHADLEDRANGGDAFSHYRLAKLLECKVPPAYLYQESLRGRVLVQQEQRWVDNYLQLKDQHECRVKHLRAAADGGVRIAAMLYAIVADDPSYKEMASKMRGVPEEQHWHTNSESRAGWSSTGLEERAEMGDLQAATQLAAKGDENWLWYLAEEALGVGNAVEPWAWQLVALHHGMDLTRSNMRAYHDGGLNDGEFYDSDFGGPMYVGGDEGLQLPEISAEQLNVAQSMAAQLLAEASN